MDHCTLENIFWNKCILDKGYSVHFNIHITAFASGSTFTAHYFIMSYFAEMDGCYAFVIKVEKGSKLTYNTAKIILSRHLARWRSFLVRVVFIGATWTLMTSGINRHTYLKRLLPTCIRHNTQVAYIFVDVNFFTFQSDLLYVRLEHYDSWHCSLVHF